MHIRLSIMEKKSKVASLFDTIISSFYCVKLFVIVESETCSWVT